MTRNEIKQLIKDCQPTYIGWSSGNQGTTENPLQYNPLAHKLLHALSQILRNIETAENKYKSAIGLGGPLSTYLFEELKYLIEDEYG